MDKTKRGIALFITLLVIASILSIVAVSFSYLEKVQKDAGKISALIQGNLLYKNTTEILKKIFPKGKTDSKKLQMVYTLPLILSEPKSGFNINLQCKPLLTGIPIKWLDEEFTKKVPEKSDLARGVLSKVIQKYEIEEPSRLEGLILEQVTEKEEQNNEYKPRLKYKKNILSKKQFDRILLDYRIRYDDNKVFQIPWDKYFIFTDVSDNTTIDGEYISPELISMIFDIPLDSVKDSWQVDTSLEEKRTTLKEFLAQNSSSEYFNKKLYSEKALNAMRCEETYTYRDTHFGFSFDYSNERNRNFEFNGEI
ncbi:MAG: hypothetical protein GXO60_04990 [Epsilonproteobacteria bacterium]|nr:hypothetical protein [Campylobacterota bacterium]